MGLIWGQGSVQDTYLQPPPPHRVFTELGGFVHRGGVTPEQDWNLLLPVEQRTGQGRSYGAGQSDRVS